jgi:hypothetical protein
VVFTDCPESAKLGMPAADAAVDRLVEHCRSVPGKFAHFSAVFLPNGRIQFDAPDGGVDADTTVPLCVLKHEPTHKLTLSRACRVEVRLVEHFLRLMQ